MCALINAVLEDVEQKLPFKSVSSLKVLPDGRHATHETKIPGGVFNYPQASFKDCSWELFATSHENAVCLNLNVLCFNSLL